MLHGSWVAGKGDATDLNKQQMTWSGSHDNACQFQPLYYNYTMRYNYTSNCRMTNFLLPYTGY